MDRLKGTINNNLELIAAALDYFEDIAAYGEVLTTAEFYMKTALTIGDKEAARMDVGGELQIKFRPLW